ncbi:MAG: dihydroneopterin triphosphate diphosphatase [Bacillota bacterium]
MYKRSESVLVVVHTGDGQVLQLLRREPEGFWQSVTGSLREGETPLKAALREVREETGLDAGAGLADGGIINRYPIHPAWRHRYAPEVRENTEYVFHLELDKPGDIRISPEHLQYRWLPRAEAAAEAGSDTDRAAILALLPAVSATGVK